MQRVSIPFGGLSNFLDSTKTGLGRAFTGSNFGCDTGILQQGPRDQIIGQRPVPDSGGLGANNPVRDVFEGGGYGKETTNAVYELQVTVAIPSSGHAVFQSPYSAETFQVQWNDTATNVANTLLGLSDFNEGQATVTGGPFPFEPIEISFGGQYAGVNPGSPLTFVSKTFNNSASAAVTQLVNGGTFEVYLVVIRNLSGSSSGCLYAVSNPNNDNWATTTWTRIVSNAMAPGQWQFQQYQDKIYGVNPLSGIGFYQLGGNSWSQPAGIPGVTIGPASPFAAPINTYPVNFDSGQWNGAAFTSTVTFAGWPTSNPTNNWVQSSVSNLQVLTINHTVTNQVVSVEINLGTDVDFSAQNYWEIHFTTVNTDAILPGSITLQLITGGAVALLPDQLDGGNTPDVNQFWRGFYFGEDSQAARKDIAKILITFNATLLTASNPLEIFYNPLDVWLNDTMASLSIGAGPVKKSISYAYTYKQLSTALETNLSPVSTTSPVPTGTIGSRAGNLIQLTAPTSGALTSSDLVKFYRLDQNQVWRCIAVIPNTGSFVNFNDGNMEDQVESLPEYGLLALPGGYLPSVICAWKGSLVLGAGPLVFMSGTGQPTLFAPSPDEFSQLSALDSSDPNNPNPRTLYMSANRSDSVVGLVPQDGLYLAGLTNNFAMVNGNFPNQLTAPLPIKNARGAVAGYQPVCPLSGGMLVCTQAGLYYYSVADYFTGSSQTSQPVEDEITKEVRGTYAQVLPNIVCQNLEDIWAVNSANGQFMHRSRNGNWDQGTLSMGAAQLLPVATNPLIAFNGRGVMTTLGVLPFTAGVPAGYSGAAPPTQVPWTWQTGIISGERQKLNHFECWYTGTPRVTVDYFDSQNPGRVPTSSQGFDLVDGKVYKTAKSPMNLNQGWRYRITVASPTGVDTVTGLDFVFDELPAAKGN